jgi:hypothetical protein
MYRLLIFALIIFGVIPFLYWLYKKIKNSKWLEENIDEVIHDPDYSTPKTTEVMKDIDRSKAELNRRTKSNEKMIEDAQKESDKIHNFLGDEAATKSSKKGGKK